MPRISSDTDRAMVRERLEKLATKLERTLSNPRVESQHQRCRHQLDLVNELRDEFCGGRK